MQHHIERLVPTPQAWITLAEAKAHLRVTHMAEDALIGVYVDAVRDYLDGYGGVLGRALTEEQWRLSIESFPCGSIRLPLAPFVSVENVVYDDAAGAEQTLDASQYRVRVSHDLGAIEPARDAVWPLDVEEVRVTYTAGYSTQKPMPAAIKAAGLLLLGSLYDLRAAEVDAKIVSHNATVDRLIAPFRVRSW